MLSNGDKAMAEVIQNDCVHKLGNLNLSAYNSKLSNRSFSDKKIFHRDVSAMKI